MVHDGTVVETRPFLSKESESRCFTCPVVFRRFYTVGISEAKRYLIMPVFRLGGGVSTLLKNYCADTYMQNAESNLLLWIEGPKVITLHRYDEY